MRRLATESDIADAVQAAEAGRAIEVSFLLELL
jgi:hypothetical protein